MLYQLSYETSLSSTTVGGCECGGGGGGSKCGVGGKCGGVDGGGDHDGDSSGGGSGCGSGECFAVVLNVMVS